jgi:hypothetical protein
MSGHKGRHQKNGSRDYKITMTNLCYENRNKRHEKKATYKKDFALDTCCSNNHYILNLRFFIL